jgi:hypothetical protein
MAAQDPHAAGLRQSIQAPSPIAVGGGDGIRERSRRRRVERRRRVIVRWLRRTATSTDSHPLARCRQALLHYRVAAVRTDLLEIAATLDTAHHTDPVSLATLHDLLANGCDSPLYKPDIHISELHGDPAPGARSLITGVVMQPQPTRELSVTRRPAALRSTRCQSTPRETASPHPRRLALDQ